MSSPIADPIGVWMLKWIMAPLGLILLTWFGIRSELRNHKCQRLATEHGFLESSYVPGRLEVPDQCHCRKKLSADGTIDDRARLDINME